MRSIRELKRTAKVALRGNYGILILASIVSAGVSFLGSMLTSALFPGDSLLEIFLSQVFAIILSLIFSVVTAGLSYMLLKVARGASCTLGDLFYFFRKHPDRVIIASTVLAVIDLVVTLPATYYSIAVEMGESMDAQMAWLTTYFVIFLVTNALSVLFGIPFAMIYYLLADEEEMGGWEAVKTSARMMKGKIGKYLLLQLSFIPLIFLSVFTFYIALLWIMPYMQMSSTMFYRDIMGELDAPVQEEVEYALGQMLAEEEGTDIPELPGDDYNSEA